jgi:hypothetical protein
VYDRLAEFIDDKLGGAGDEEVYTWEDAALFIEEEKQRGEIFKTKGAGLYLKYSGCPAQNKYCREVQFSQRYSKDGAQGTL